MVFIGFSKNAGMKKEIIMNKDIKKFIKIVLILAKWLLILLTLVLFVLMAFNIIEISLGWSFLFKYFQLYFHWDINFIRIISLVFAFVFLFFVLPCIFKVFNPIKPRSKKILPAFIIVCFFCSLWFITYLGKKDIKFDAKGNSLYGMAWAGDHYEEVEKHFEVHPVYGTPVYKVTRENLSSFSLKKIEVNENTVFFSPVDGTPLVYYYIMGSKFEFFNSKGRHPRYGEELSPVTPDIIKYYFAQIETERKKAAEEEMKRQELETKRLAELISELSKSNATSSSTRRATNNALSSSSNSKWIGNVEYYPETIRGIGGVRFVNHNDYPVRVFWKLPDGSENGIWDLGANRDFWTDYHYSVISSVRVIQTW